MCSPNGRTAAAFERKLSHENSLSASSLACTMCSPGVGEQLLISTSPAVAEALRAAAALPELPADVRAEALRHAESGAVPWRLLHRTCRALRQAGKGASLTGALWHSGSRCTT